MATALRSSGRIVLALAVLLALPALASATRHQVNIQNFAFVPAGLHISLGDTVRWTNLDAFQHTSTSDNGVWDSGLLNQNQSFQFQFTGMGSFPNHCAVHLFMKDTIWVVPTGIEENQSNLPGEFRLNQNYPNPFNARTTISFTLDNPGHAVLGVYNVLGQKIDVLVDRDLDAGNYSYDWDAGSQASGVFFYRLTFDDKSQTGRMVLLK